jgi:hypothetical protein
MKAEFREFFLRAVQVLSGSKRDQETGYPTTTTVNGSSRGNRFLDGHVPTNGVFAKLFASIPFKLNSEDAATTAQQGLTRLATDVEAAAFDSTVNSKGYQPVVQPHQVTKHYGGNVPLTETIGGKTVNVLYDGGIVLASQDENTDTSEFVPGGYQPAYLVTLNKTALPTDSSRVRFNIRVQNTDSSLDPTCAFGLFVIGTSSTNVFGRTATGTGTNDSYTITGEIIRLSSTTVKVIYYATNLLAGTFMGAYEGVSAVLTVADLDTSTNSFEFRISFNGAITPNWIPNYANFIREVK